MNTLSRFQGALLGLAIGDALGTTLEFQRPGEFEPITDMVGGGAFNLKAGKWTDDTSMALCLAQSLIECKDFNPYDQMDKYLDWYIKGYMSSVKGRCVDIGYATKNALLNYYDQRHQPFCGKMDRNSAGNGSIMRLAPVPMFYFGDIDNVIFKSEISSKTTHRAPQSLDGCRLFSLLIHEALEGKTKEEILTDKSESEYWEDLPLDEEILPVSKGSFKHLSPPEIVGSGYVVKSLEAALWAFYHSTSFEEGALMAANLGNDADTTAAVFGQLAGAYYGKEGIPKKWIEKLYMNEEIEKIGLSLFELNRDNGQNHNN